MANYYDELQCILCGEIFTEEERKAMNEHMKTHKSKVVQ